jgi:hypothetical protein
MYYIEGYESRGWRTRRTRLGQSHIQFNCLYYDDTFKQWVPRGEKGTSCLRMAGILEV